MAALKKIGNFEIVKHLGKGGMGDVYQALQQPLGRKVALKVLFSNNADDEESRKRFEIEAKAVSRLEHTNIVSLYDYGIANGLHYISMQYIEGTGLFEAIPKKGLPIEQVIDYSKQICRGLLYAHKNGIVHRDIKPQNIIIDKTNSCKITDFGIAQIFREKSITMTGIAVGTPEYMSPEQASGKKLDHKTDIYSLGILMYEMLTGVVPFTGKNAVAVAYKQVHELPEPPSVHRKGIPKRLELVIVKALKKDVNQRYESIEQLLDDIDTIEFEDTDSPFKKARPKDPDDTRSNRRITDRRGGDRRGGGSTTQIGAVPFEPWKPLFWVSTLKQQWLSLLLIVILYVLHFTTK